MDSSLSWYVVPKQAVITYLIKLWQYPPTSGITYCQREGNLKGKCWGLSEILWRQCSDSRGEKGTQYPTLRVISNTLRSTRHDKNIAPAEGFVMRDRLLFSLGEKNCFLIASAYFTYIMSQTQCGHVTAWEVFGERDSCSSSHFHQKTFPDEFIQIFSF